MYSGGCEGKTPKVSRFTHLGTGGVNYCCISNHCNQKERNYERIMERLRFLGIKVPRGKDFTYYFCIDIQNAIGEGAKKPSQSGE